MVVDMRHESSDNAAAGAGAFSFLKLPRELRDQVRT